MTYELNIVYAAWTLLGVVIGLLAGRLTWGRAARRHKRVADSVASAAAAAAARTHAEHSTRELAAAQAAMRPLADEVDRLKRELAKAKRPVQTPLPLESDALAAVAMPPVAPGGNAAADVQSPVAPPHAPPAGVAADRPHVAPAEAVAGTGPIVVGAGNGPEFAAAAPGIRQLKGVGDRFAAALDGLGLGSLDAIARLTADEALDADTRLGTFNGRIAKDRLVEQAVLLDEGRTTEYEARFGKLG